MNNADVVFDRETIIRILATVFGTIAYFAVVFIALAGEYKKPRNRGGH